MARALKLPIGHPSQMPVTRDLSDAKRALLLKWLQDVGDDGKPKQSAALESVAMNVIESVALRVRIVISLCAALLKYA